MVLVIFTERPRWLDISILGTVKITINPLYHWCPAADPHSDATRQFRVRVQPFQTPCLHLQPPCIVNMVSKQRAWSRGSCFQDPHGSWLLLLIWGIKVHLFNMKHGSLQNCILTIHCSTEELYPVGLQHVDFNPYMRTQRLPIRSKNSKVTADWRALELCSNAAQLKFPSPLFSSIQNYFKSEHLLLQRGENFVRTETAISILLIRECISKSSICQLMHNRVALKEY